MNANSPPISIPSSYETLPVTDIKLSHHPPSPTATPILIVTLNRPEKHNAYTQAMGESLERVFFTVNIDDRIKAIVLTGAGRTFCAGADLDIGLSGPKHIDPEIYRDRQAPFPSPFIEATRLIVKVAAASPWQSTAVENPPSPQCKAPPSAWE